MGGRAASLWNILHHHHHYYYYYYYYYTLFQALNLGLSCIAAAHQLWLSKLTYSDMHDIHYIAMYHFRVVEMCLSFQQDCVVKSANIRQT
jgi:hypothetical protein